MNEGTDIERSKIIENLERLNVNVGHQMTMWHIFRNGIIYGFGFVIGSTILTALIVSFTFQFFGDSVFAQVMFWLAETVR